MYYYVGTVLLGMSCREFWHTTPRKLSSLVQIHVDLNTPKKTSKQLPGMEGVSPVAEMPHGIPNSRKPGEGVGEPNAFIDQIF